MRATYAPLMVSMEHKCIVAGQAMEINALSDLDLLLDVIQFT